MRRDEGTYGGISRKYDAWRESEKDRPPPPQVRSDRPYVHQRYQSSDMGRMVFAAIGIGIGVILLVLSGLAFFAGSGWSEYGRDSAVVGWTVAGVFLLVAGLGCIISTWNHNFRVLVRPPEQHH